MAAVRAISQVAPMVVREAINNKEAAAADGDRITAYIRKAKSTRKIRKETCHSPGTAHEDVCLRKD